MKAMNMHIFHTQFLPKILIFINIIPFEPPSGDLAGVTLNHSDKSKFKADPLQAWSGPESSRKLRVRD